ncbi:hypothetical protein BH11CYA1_BH11CYA1_36210 [soil metagenome]
MNALTIARTAVNRQFIWRCTFSLVFSLSAILVPQLGRSSVYAQSGQKVRSITCDFVSEDQCPVDMASIRCELDLDPFDAPMSSRIYADYKNTSQRAISAVKFRIRFVDGEGVERGTFHAVDSAYVAAGGTKGHKWKRDFTLDPRVVAMKVRVLQVKYAEGGGDWQSVKMQELAQPGSADPAPSGAPGAGAGGP